MSCVYFCDICSSIVSRTGVLQTGFIGIGDTVINACIDCQNAVGEFIASRQEEKFVKADTVEIIPNIDFVAALKEKNEKSTVEVVDVEA